MHEVSLVDALLDQAAEAIAPASPAALRVVRVRMGELSGVEPELFRLAFEALAEERGLQRARLELILEPAIWECDLCNVVIQPGSVLTCPACGAPARLRAGDALVLERLELEVPGV